LAGRQIAVRIIGVHEIENPFGHDRMTHTAPYSPQNAGFHVGHAVVIDDDFCVWRIRRALAARADHYHRAAP
jgi:uncharacterized protein YhaN